MKFKNFIDLLTDRASIYLWVTEDGEKKFKGTFLRFYIAKHTEYFDYTIQSIDSDEWVSEKDHNSNKVHGICVTITNTNI